jgi:hypothetical protein
MSTLLLERLPALDLGFRCEADRGRDVQLVAGSTDAYGRLTLDELITSVWEGLAVRDTVSCPVCEGPMATGAPNGGEESPSGVCLDCGSQLC